ncbi:AAA family ATPase [Cognatishimia maritima]|uniref:Pilus assembly protein CpaE n=1 Tax=Cognatishimia maritima TaxID=870908 RepID=A0A1M5KUW0_9RHOB|nr:AAA family ATPase [Cognatishimia maritima]SHG56557.1 pilus assembly protein CpaE [Cognatishimia maritima]
MTSSETKISDPNAILACTVCRDVQNFDLLIVDMEEVMGEQWGDLGFEDVLQFFEQPEADTLEFIALAIDDLDEDGPEILKKIVIAAKEKGIKTLLIAEDVTPSLLHQLLRMGADEFIPYPPPSGELLQVVETMRAEPEEPARLPVPDPATQPAEAGTVSLNASAPRRHGVIIAAHGLAGGTGTTTLAVNLAWELATVTKEKSPSVCLLDFDLQFGSTSTFLDLPRRDAVFELLSDTDSMDSESFGQALQKFEDKLSVLTSPPDMLPLDLISSEDIERVLEMASHHFDFVVVDMPNTVVQWTETVLNKAHVYFATLEIDMRSAQNAMRMKRALQAEDLPFDKLRYVLNRAPKFTDLSGKSRVKRMAESLGISIDVMLPDGGRPVMQASDHGQPLGLLASKNPLRKEIAKLAKSIFELDEDNIQAA